MKVPFGYATKLESITHATGRSIYGPFGASLSIDPKTP